MSRTAADRALGSYTQLGFLGMTERGTRLAPSSPMYPLAEFRRLVRFLTIEHDTAPTAEGLLWHLRELYREIPGLALTTADVREAFQTSERRCEAVLSALLAGRFLRAHGDRLTIREPAS